jgi:hypothetical protein
MAENMPDKDSFKAWHDYYTNQAKKSSKETVITTTRPIGGGISIRAKQQKLTSVVTNPREGDTSKTTHKVLPVKLTSPAGETLEKAKSEIKYNNEMIDAMPKPVIRSSRGRKATTSSRKRQKKRKLQANTSDIFSKKFKAGK